MCVGACGRCVLGFIVGRRLVDGCVGAGSGLFSWRSAWWCIGCVGECWEGGIVMGMGKMLVGKWWGGLVIDIVCIMGMLIGLIDNGVV